MKPLGFSLNVGRAHSASDRPAGRPLALCADRGGDRQLAPHPGSEALAAKPLPSQPMIPLVFDGCRGWLHAANGSLGVVMCSGHGFEELCARKSWRLLADQLAAAGLPTLRFDYPGCGDSIGSDLDSDRVSAWTASIGSAIDALKSASGVERVALVGLRFGALLAANVAARADVDALCLLAPPSSGKAYTRELRAMTRIMSADYHTSAGAAEPDAHLSICGFVTTNATRASMERLALSPPSGRQSRPALVLSHDAPAGRDVAASLDKDGWSVTHDHFRGYAEMMCEPTASRCPFEAWRRVAEWICSHNRPRTVPCAFSPSTASELADGSWREEAVLFGERGDLVGILTTPSALPDPDQPLLLIGNAGGCYHAGWARQTVDLARTVASSGIATLRFNFAGIGDSPDALQQSGAVYYAATGTQDLMAAMSWARSQGYRRVIGVGSCSAAYQLFHAAEKDERFGEVILVNLQCFEWTPAFQLDLRAWQMTRSHMLEKMRREAADGRAGAETGLRRYPLVVAKAARRAVVATLRRVTSLIQKQRGGSRLAERRMGKIISRGVRMMMIYSADDKGLIELEDKFGPPESAQFKKSGFDFVLIENADHTLTQLAARRSLTAIVQDFVERKPRMQT